MQLIKKWNTFLESDDFIKEYRSGETDFTRKRSYSFKSLFLFITSSVQSSLQRELDRFFSAWNNAEVTERFVTQSSFSQARKKIKPEAFSKLNRYVVDDFYARGVHKKWHGFRLVGIDGTDVFLPKNSGTIEAFGEYTTNLMNGTVVLARASKAYDVLNNITLDAKLANRNIGEHALAGEHLEHLSIGDLCILDRGYPSFDLFRKMMDKGIHFCFRLPISNWNAAKALVVSGQKETVAEICPGNTLKKRYREEGIAVVPLKLRLVCVKLPNGEKEVLITSLLDDKIFPFELFQELYHLRWGVEESYKKDKHRLQLENFSGKSVVAVQQDFHANILMGNLASMLSTKARGAIEETLDAKKPLKHRYVINMTTALAKVKEMLPKLFSRESIVSLLSKLMKMFLSNLLPVRPNRSFERRMGKKKRYHKCYLPL